MRICYVTMQFPTTYETFAVRDVRTLQRMGARVTVQSLRPAHPSAAALYGEYGLDPDTPVVHNSPARTLSGIGTALRRPTVLLALTGWIFARCWRRPGHLLRSLILVPRVIDIVEQIRRERPDVVHLFWGHYPAMVGRLVRIRLPGTTLSVFIGAYDLVWGYGGTPPVARSADVVWTHALENVPAIAALGVDRERIAVAYRGVDLSRFHTAGAPKVARRIVTASRLIPAKGVDDVLKAFAHVLRDWPDATLVVLGDGPDQRRLEALAGDLGIAHAVAFLGHVDQGVVAAELQAAEVFLLMSRNGSERLPNVVKEALACRCVCVVAESPGIEELVRDGVHGFVVPQGDVEGAAGRIRAIFERRVDVEAMTRAGSDHVRTHFDVERTMSLYLERWRRLTRPADAAARPGEAEQGDSSADRHIGIDRRTPVRSPWLAGNAKRIGSHGGRLLHLAFGSRARGRFGILMYHRLFAADPSVPTPTWNVRPARFREQLESLLEHGYTVLPLRRILDDSAHGRPLPGKLTAITFDDGYAQVYHHAWPVLKALGVPATVFVATAYVGSEHPFPFDGWGRSNRDRVPASAWKALTWSQCREMEASGLVEIGSHTHTHRDFRGDAAVLHDDIARSLEVLERELGPRDYTFSLPYGSRTLGHADDALLRAAEAAGVRCALTTDAELVTPGSHPYGWGRFEVIDQDTGRTLVAKLEGWYAWMGAIREAYRITRRPRRRARVAAR